MAGPFYLRSTDGADVPGGLSWADAFATLAYAFTQMAAGETLFVSQNHAETQASSITATSPGTVANPCLVLCGNDAAEPPTTLATTATVTTTGNTNILIGGSLYVYGITFTAADTSGTGTSQIHLASTSINATVVQIFDNCKLVLRGTSGGIPTIRMAASSGGTNSRSLVEFIDTNVQFDDVDDRIYPYINFNWRGGAIQNLAPTILFDPQNRALGNVEISGVDLSIMGSGKSLVDVSGPLTQSYCLSNCKLGSSVSLTTGAPVGPGGISVRVVNCDSADTNYRYQKAIYQGDITQETIIVRTGGASDGVTPISRKMVSSANPEFFSPLVSDPCIVRNETVGSSVTATIEVITDNVTLTDAEAWIEVEYLGTSGFPLSLFADDRAADILATPANQTSSSVAWTTTGLSTPLKQKLSVTFTPEEKGPIQVRVMLAKASTTMYFCPKVDIS